MVYRGDGIHWPKLRKYVLDVKLVVDIEWLFKAVLVHC